MKSNGYVPKKRLQKNNKRCVWNEFVAKHTHSSQNDYSCLNNTTQLVITRLFACKVAAADSSLFAVNVFFLCLFVVFVGIPSNKVSANIQHMHTHIELNRSTNSANQFTIDTLTMPHFTLCMCCKQNLSCQKMCRVSHVCCPYVCVDIWNIWT